MNPRLVESKVGDEANVKKTETEYYPVSPTYPIALVKEVRLYGANQTTVEKRAVTDYNTSAAYLSRRMIGLPSKTEVYGLNQQTNLTELISKATYTYDEGDFTGTEQNLSSVIQHDNTSYGASFIAGRGNLTKTTRCDAALSSEFNCVGGVSSEARYNTAGAVVKQISPDVSGNLNREVKISYADSFNDTSVSRNTYAYPTRITTAGATQGSEVFSDVKYRFDIGANVWAKSPAPAGNTTGKETTREFDTFGRLLKETLVNNGAYTRYEYFPSGIQSKAFTTAASGTGEVESESRTDGAGRVLKARTELPNSTGGWSGSLVEYDPLGQVKRSSVPTEISVNETTNVWTPAGDDNRGVDAQGNPVWLWTSQEYDWKGRVTRQINTDGTDKTIAYEGCGCAGGQMTTVKGENIVETDWQGNTTATPGRRTQKIYADHQGRTKKTEIYDWNGTGQPYATTIVEFNGRDQAISVKRYAGAEGTGTPQETTMTYDGFGRLKTQHRPEQIKPDTTLGYTTYNYNLDDSISSVVDARGAGTNYVYNNRGLLEQVNYSRPSGSSLQIPATANFTYDALGNRISMTETTNTTAGGIAGLGGTTYAYDSLSRLTSETRTINDTATGFNQQFTFDYTYNLAGQLTEFKDPNDLTRKVTYERDKIGRVTAVGGGGFGSSNVTSYASSLQYRAFGAVESLTYGSGKQLTQTFNNRLQLDEFNVSGGGTTADNLASKNKYYADGRIKSAGSLPGSTYSDKFDRLYKYDHLGRIVEAKSGIEARDPAATSSDRPYRQTYDYNAFGNLTSRTGLLWNTTADPLTATYTNNRRSDLYWGYDADGRNTATEDFYSYYDAAGRRYLSSGNSEITQTFDGGGRRIKQTEQPPSGGLKKRYYVNSSVLGTIYEIEFISPTNWKKKVGMVYLNGQKIAIQNTASNNTQAVWWFYENPVTGATRGTLTNMASEPDPLGVNNGLAAPPPEPPEYPDYVPDLIIPRHADALNLAAGCTLDGQPVSCDVANTAMEAGAAMQCPNNECGPRVLYLTNSEGETRGILLTAFMGFMNGISGNFFPTWMGLGTPQEQADRTATGIALAQLGLTVSQVTQIDTRKPSTIMRSNFTGFKIGTRGGTFTPDQEKRMKKAYERITKKGCLDYINGLLEPYINRWEESGQWGSIGATSALDLISKGTFHSYDSSLTAEQMGITEKQRQELRDNDVWYSSFKGATLGNNVWLNSPMVFRAGGKLLQPKIDLSVVIVHELLHIFGFNESEISNSEIQKHCGEGGAI